MVKKIFNINNNPNICIGTDKNYTDETLINFTINHFKKYGYSVAINNTYSGTMIPNKYFNKYDKRIKSIMLEVNKRIYLKDKKCFYRFKNYLNDYYKEIELKQKL